MTWEECSNALRQYDRRVYLLALVSQIQEDVLAKCDDDARPLADRALDAARRWCLGEATQEECRAASAAYAYATPTAYRAAYAAAYAATSAAYRAAYADAAAYAANAAAYAASAADAANAAITDATHAATSAAYRAAYAAADAAEYVAAYAARARLVESLADAPTTWQDAVVAGGNVRTATHVWWRDGRFGGRWKRLTDADAVRFDALEGK